MELIEVKKLNTTIEKVLNRQMAELGITSTQANVVIFLILSENTTVYQKNIEEALGLSHATISGVLKKMAEKNIVRFSVSESDHRFKSVMLTDYSRQLYDSLYQKTKSVYERAFQGFSEDEILQFSAFLSRMNDNLS